MSKLTFYLFARPSFVEGWARILDLGTTLDVYNESETGKEADYIAMENDWMTVGDDIRAAISKYEQEKKKTQITKD